MAEIRFLSQAPKYIWDLSSFKGYGQGRKSIHKIYHSNLFFVGLSKKHVQWVLLNFWNSFIQESYHGISMQMSGTGQLHLYLTLKQHFKRGWPCIVFLMYGFWSVGWTWAHLWSNEESYTYLWLGSGKSHSCFSYDRRRVLKLSQNEMKYLP